MPNSFIKSFYLAFISLVITLAVKADYDYLSLYQIILGSNHCAEGTIVKLDDDYFYLKVDRYLMGRLEEDTVGISRFQNWTCGERIEEYSIGQKEIVFFYKSNYVIPVFDFLGIGGGDEHELAIVEDTVYYHKSYGGEVAMPKNEFARLISDYSTAKDKGGRLDSNNYENSYIKYTAFRLDRALNETDEEINKYKDSDKQHALLVNLVQQVLYKNYENKILYYANDNSKVFPFATNSEVRMIGDTIFLIPTDESFWVNLSIYSDAVRTPETQLAYQNYKVIDLPSPKLYFDNSYSDTLYIQHIGLFMNRLKAGYLLNDYQIDQNLKYRILNYTLQRHHKGSVESIFVKSSRGTKSLRDFMNRVKPYDTIVYKDPAVLYPNGVMHTIPDQTFFIFPYSDKTIHHPTGND